MEGELKDKPGGAGRQLAGAEKCFAGTLYGEDGSGATL